ncbi:N-acetylmannosamine kinase [Escherichia coli O54:H45]
MATLAIDIGGTKISAAIIGRDRKLMMRRQRSTPHNRSKIHLENAINQLVTPLLPFASCYAVAATGIINNGVLTALNPSNLGGLDNYPLEEHLSHLTGLQGICINDAHAAAWAEYKWISEKLNNMVYITVSTGVGGAIITDGKLLLSKNGLAGHLGHLLSDINGPVCGCGRKGCVEAIASGSAIMKAAHDKLSGLKTKEIFLYAEQGDPEAISLVENSSRSIAGLIADLKMITDSQLVVIGGSVGLARGYLDRVSKHLSEYPSTYHIPISPAIYKHDSGLLGAAIWAEETIMP